MQKAGGMLCKALQARRCWSRGWTPKDVCICSGGPRTSQHKLLFAAQMTTSLDAAFSWKDKHTKKRPCSA